MGAAIRQRVPVASEPSPSSLPSTEPTVGTASPVLERGYLAGLIFVGLWPVLWGWFTDWADPISVVEDWLIAGSRVPRIEAPVIASQLSFLPDAAFCFLPGLVVGLRHLRPACVPPARPRHVWATTLLTGFVTALVGFVGHITVDLPTGWLGSAELIARVRVQTRLVDVVVNSVLPAITEELYYRGLLFVAIAAVRSTRVTILLTAVAFALGHPPLLIPWALFFGLVVGKARSRLGSVWPVVACHAVWNAIAYADAWYLIG